MSQCDGGALNVGLASAIDIGVRAWEISIDHCEANGRMVVMGYCMSRGGRAVVW